MKCPKCQHENPNAQKFCGECGQKLAKLPETEKVMPEIKGERKHVTVLFSDLSGYTALSEKLDPEEVKEISSRIFGEIVQVVTKYEGFIEKFIGDAVMAIFGVIRSYEDDPVRAIRAAREIHNLVESLSPKYEKVIGRPLSMHSGINTGLVVTGEVDMEKGTHGISGDTVNLAARLSSLGKAGEILVGPDTHCQAEGHFNFEDLGPTKIKGKTEAIRVYKVIDLKGHPRKVRRIHGLRAKLIGRKIEIDQLIEAVNRLEYGKGSIFSICGAAGTGKSRLIEDFKAILDLEKIQWREGHAYPYAQNIPYFPLINLLSRAFQIEESDSQEKVRTKIESGIEILIGKIDDVIPYIGSLFTLSYPEIAEISPDSWKFHLQKAIQKILAALTQRGPTVICLEDLHWADPSSLELIRLILTETRHPALFLCVYRPIIKLFSSHQLDILGELYKEIALYDLSPSEMQEMLESLLRTETIPPDLSKFVQGKIEGNPFYLEEVINSLIESETLIRRDEDWVLTRPISKSEVSPTIHGVISSRLDRLGKETKRVLREASVIGGAFLYRILEKITDLEEHLDESLSMLESHDMIRVRSLEPDLEYVFKHSLTHEVVYNGLLKKERQEVHERIALVMEKLFHDRLPEFYETLAFHFKQGQSLQKAVEYLVKSGEKSLGKYSVEESHEYFKEAYNLLSNKPEKTKDEKKLIIDIFLKWAFVFNHRGEYQKLADLFHSHIDLAESLGDEEMLGMFYAWIGSAFRAREKLEDAYKLLSKALKIGERIENNKVIGYACAWLSWTCGDLGLLDEALIYAKRAQKISEVYKRDKELFRFTFVGMGWTHVFRGENKKVVKTGRILLEYGQSESDMRCVNMGYSIIGAGYFTAGDFPSAIEWNKRAIQIAPDPIFSSSARLLLGIAYVAHGQLQEAEKILEEVKQLSENLSAEFIGTVGQFFLGIISVARGNLRQGELIVEDLLRLWFESGSKYRYALGRLMLGKFYLQIVQKVEPKSFSFLIRNIGFLIKNVPFAKKKAEVHFNETIEVAIKIGAKSLLGQAYLALGLIHKSRHRTEQARQCITQAIELFEEYEAEVYLKQAEEALEALE